jgi:hypothetical protein
MKLTTIAAKLRMTAAEMEADPLVTDAQRRLALQ